MAQHQQTSRSNQTRQSHIIQQLLGERGRAPADIFFTIRRVGEYQLEALSTILCELSQRSEDVLYTHLQHIRGISSKPKILLKNGGVTGRFFNTYCRSRAPAKTFEAKSARSRKQFENTRARDSSSQAVEDCLLDQVRCRTHVEAFWHFEYTSSCLATRNAHTRNLRKTSVAAKSKRKVGLDSMNPLESIVENKSCCG